MTTSDIGYAGLATSLVLIVVGIVLSRVQRLELEVPIVIAVARAMVQLLIVGVALQLVIDEGRPLAWAWLWVAVMAVFAASTVQRRVPRLPGVFAAGLVAFALSLGVSLLVTFGFGIFPLEARALVPVSGMIVGNAMTGSVVAARSLSDAIADRRLDIEARLALGLSKWLAIRPTLRAALRLGLVPQIESTKAVGIVFLPGAMTGLILAGVDPADAVLIQAALLFLILGSVAVNVTVIGLVGAASAFTPDHRLVPIPR